MTTVPRDDEAEAVVVGCSVALARGYELAAVRVRPDDFWGPTARRLFEACASLGHIIGTGPDDTERRIYEVARLSGVALPTIRQLVDDRPVEWDRTGWYTNRVRLASQARTVMATCAEVYNRLGDGERLEILAAEIPAVELLRGAA